MRVCLLSWHAREDSARSTLASGGASARLAFRGTSSDVLFAGSEHSLFILIQISELILLIIFSLLFSLKQKRYRHKRLGTIARSKLMIGSMSTHAASQITSSACCFCWVWTSHQLIYVLVH